jgi:hypothetical protein
METINKYWEKLMVFLQKKDVYFTTPIVLLVAILLATKSILAFIALVFWMLVLTANVEKD